MKSKNEKIASEIIKGIWSDIYGRSGGDHFLDCGGEYNAKETQADMKAQWKKVILKALNRKPRGKHGA